MNLLQFIFQTPLMFFGCLWCGQLHINYGHCQCRWLTDGENSSLCLFVCVLRSELHRLRPLTQRIHSPKIVGTGYIVDGILCDTFGLVRQPKSLWLHFNIFNSIHQYNSVDNRFKWNSLCTSFDQSRTIIR